MTCPILRSVFGTILVTLATEPGNNENKLFPGFRKQGSRFLHPGAPDLHHLFIVTLIKTAVVAVLEIVPERFWIETAHFLQIAHRLLFQGHLDLWQARPWKIFHPRRVRGDGIDRLDLSPNFGCVPPVMKLDPHARMICHPFAGESVCRRVAAMAVDDQDSSKALLR